MAALRKSGVGGALLTAIALTSWACAQPPESEEPPPPPPQNQIEIKEFGDLQLKGEGALLAEGAIRAIWREYLLQSDRVEGSTKSGQYLFSRGATLTTDGFQARADQIWLDTKTRQWRAENGTARLSPQYLQSETLLQDLFIGGGRLSGEPDHITAEEAHATTCDLDHPHFVWISRSADAVPQQRAVLRHVKLRVLDKTLFSLPYVVIPLDERSQRNTLPDVGYSEEEGYYLKYALGYLLAQNTIGNARLDLMQRKGIGLGVNQNYRYGEANLYALNDRSRGSSDFTGRFTHQRIWAGIDTNTLFEFRQNSYLSLPNNQTWNFTTDWQKPDPKGQISFNARMNSSKTSGFENRARAFTLSDTRSIGRMQWNLSSELFDTENFNQGERSNKREEATIQTRFLYQLASETPYASDLNAQLDFNRSIPIRVQGQFYRGLERAPELSLVGRTNLPLLASPRFRLSVGSFTESGFQTAIKAERYSLDLQGQYRSNAPVRRPSPTGPTAPQGPPQGPVRPSEENPTVPLLINPFSAPIGFQTMPPTPQRTRPSSQGLSWNYGFRQNFYSDETAQYLLRSDLEQQFAWRAQSTVTLRWNYLRPYGYSPLQYDRSGFYNQLSADLRWQMGGGWSLAAQTGYDLLARSLDRDPWQSLGLNILYQREEWLRWRVNGIYDANSGRMNNLLTDLFWQFGESRLAVSARYDPRRSKWGSVYARLDALKWGRAKFSSILQYNGYVNRFEGRHFLITYDLHCAELELRYIDNPFGFRRDRDLMLFLRIKALPSASRFGYGQFGQALGGSGETF